MTCKPHVRTQYALVDGERLARRRVVGAKGSHHLVSLRTNTTLCGLRCARWSAAIGTSSCCQACSAEATQRSGAARARSSG